MKKYWAAVNLKALGILLSQSTICSLDNKRESINSCFVTQIPNGDEGAISHECMTMFQTSVWRLLSSHKSGEFCGWHQSLNRGLKAGKK